jgi:hypothetical protein
MVLVCKCHVLLILVVVEVANINAGTEAFTTIKDRKDRVCCLTIHYVINKKKRGLQLNPLSDILEYWLLLRVLVNRNPAAAYGEHYGMGSIIGVQLA